MPHGLDIERANELLAMKRPVWVAKLKTREGSVTRPMLLLSVQGVNAVVLDKTHKSTYRIPLAKIEAARAPEESAAKAKPLLMPRPMPETFGEPRVVITPEVPINPRVAAAVNAKAKRVIRHPVTGRYYTERHSWTTALDEARRYDSQGINRAIGRMTGKGGHEHGVALEALTEDQALAQLIPPSPPPPPTDPAPQSTSAAAPPEPVAPPPPAASPEITPPTSDTAALRAAFEAFVSAAHIAAEAHATMLRAQADAVIAEHQVTMLRKRAEHGL